MALLRLIRFPNLVIVALTQGLLSFWRCCRRTANTRFVLPWTRCFWPVCGVTVLLTAGGYIINDIEDKTDLANRPERVIVGKRISGR